MSPEGLAAFREELSPSDEVAMEAGPNAYYFHDQVAAVIARVVIVSPPQFAVIAKSTKKTDRQDAIALARFLKLGCLPEVSLPSPKIRELRQLFTTREMLVSIGRGLKNMGHAALIRNGLISTKASFATHIGRQRLARLDGLPPSDRLILDAVLRQLDAVDTEIAQLERAIIRAGKNLPGLKRLLQIRGFGLVAAIGVLTEIGDIHNFASAKQLVSYAGLATSVRQSGSMDRRGHITKAGRKRLRGFLVEAVLSMIRDQAHNSMSTFYQRKKKEKGAGKAICATAHKLLTIVYTILTKELDYWFLEERLYQKKLKALEKVEAAA